MQAARNSTARVPAGLGDSQAEDGGTLHFQGVADNPTVETTNEQVSRLLRQG